MDAIYILAQATADTGYEKLPTDVVEVTKRQILDSLAVALAGSTAPGTGELIEIVKDWGGKKEIGGRKYNEGTFVRYSSTGLIAIYSWPFWVYAPRRYGCRSNQN